MISVDFIFSNNETVALDHDDLHSAGSGNWKTRKSIE